MKLKNKVAVVTGAASGIGHEIVSSQKVWESGKII